MKTIRICLLGLLSLLIFIGCDFITKSEVVGAKSGGGDDPTIYYTIRFNTDGGSSCANETAKYGEWIQLPHTSKSGYTFTGWFSANSGGVRVGNIGDWYEVKGNATLFARWTSNGGNQSALVGTWIGEYGTIIVFNSDGTGAMIFGDELYSEIRWATATNGTTIVVTFLERDVISFFGGNTFNWDGNIWTRTSGSGSNIVGTWEFIWPWGCNSIMVFNQNGTGTYSGYYEGVLDFQENFTYTQSGTMVMIDFILGTNRFEYFDGNSFVFGNGHTYRRQ